MNLYIRSQDKYTLVKYNKNIKIIETKGLKEAFEDSAFDFLKDMEQIQDYLKDGWSIIVDDINLGVYKTKERALEVLGEIQDILMPRLRIKKGDEVYDLYGNIVRNDILNKENEIQELSTFVYELPKE